MAEICVQLELDFYMNDPKIVAPAMINNRICVRKDGAIFKYVVTETQYLDGIKEEDLDPGQIKIVNFKGLPIMSIICGDSQYRAPVTIRAIKGVKGPVKVANRIHAIDFDKENIGMSDRIWMEHNNKSIVGWHLHRFGLIREVEYAPRQMSARSSPKKQSPNKSSPKSSPKAASPKSSPKAASPKSSPKAASTKEASPKKTSPKKETSEYDTFDTYSDSDFLI